MKRQFIPFSFLLFFFFLSRSYTSKAQYNDSCTIQISLLTCTPGEELYSSFGHSALRVVNLENGKDIVFNYGTFDFDDPDFYSKFVKGKLLYFVSVDTYPDFMQEYQYFKRGVTEQVLNLTCDEKQQLLYALYENAREENKYYKYDFTYDNCTTRLRDIIEKATNDSLATKDILPYPGVTFRKLIHDYLERGGQYWSELGIDILLGAPLDKKLSNREAMFLPDYLMKAFDSTTVNGRPLVTEKRELLPYTALSSAPVFFKPIIISSILFLIILLAGFSRSKNIRMFLKTADVVLVGLSGLIGILLVFMWLGTDHVMCKNNMNLLWAIPFNIIMVFFIFSRKRFVKNYYRVISIILLVLLLAWFFLPQQLNIALLPIAATLCIRTYFISKKAYNGQ